VGEAVLAYLAALGDVAEVDEDLDWKVAGGGGGAGSAGVGGVEIRVG